MMTLKEKQKYVKNINKNFKNYSIYLKYDDLITYNESFKLIINKIENNIELTRKEIILLEMLEEYNYIFEKEN